MQAAATELHRHPVEREAVLHGELDLADAEGHRGGIHHFATDQYLDPGMAEERRIGGPKRWRLDVEGRRDFHRTATARRCVGFPGLQGLSSRTKQIGRA